MTPQDEAQQQRVETIAAILYRNISPERCCLRMSANVSYAHAATDGELLTGMRVSAKTQQRLVQRQSFEELALSQPATETSIAGGMVRLLAASGGRLQKYDSIKGY